MLSVVGIAKREGRSVHDTVVTALDLIGGISRYIKPGDNVVIKPNFTGNLPVGSGAITDPCVIDSVVQVVRELAPRRLVIAEACGPIHVGTQKIYHQVGLDTIARKYGADLIDANHDEMVTVECREGLVLERVQIARTFLDADVLVNVPVVKTHFITGISICVKNLKGCIPWREKRRFHEIGVHAAIVDLYGLLKPHLNVVDGIVAMEGLGPAEGEPVPLGLVIAGNDGVAVDSVCAAIMGFDPSGLQYLRLASERGLGQADLESIRVLGSTINEVRRQFKPALAELEPIEGVTVISGEPCSGCIAAVHLALARMRTYGTLEKMLARGKEITIILGPSAEFRDDDGVVFAVGKCAEKHKRAGAIFIPGCAPAALEVEDVMRNHFGIPRDSDATFLAKRDVRPNVHEGDQAGS